MEKTNKNKKYKESEVSWIGKIPIHWDVKKLKYVLDGLGSGKGISRENLSADGEYPVIGGNGVMGRTDSYNVDGFGVAIGRVGAYCGNIHGLNGFFYVTDNALYSKINEEFYTEFIVQTLRAMNLNQYASQTAQPLLTQTLINNKKIPVPPLEEQKRITNFLSTVTSKFDILLVNNKKKIKLLEEKKKSLINNILTKGVTASTATQKSSLPGIESYPLEWQLNKLKYHLLPGNEGIKIGPFGSSLKLDEMDSEGDYKVYGQSNVIRKNFQYGKKYIGNEKYDELKVYKIQSGDLVITMMGTAGLAMCLPEGVQKGIMDSHLTRINPSSTLNPKYLEILINEADYVITQRIKMSKGSIMAGLNSSILKELLILIPPVDQQNLIVASVLNISEKYQRAISSIKKENQLLNEYKQSLIYHVVTGKVDVRNEVKS